MHDDDQYRERSTPPRISSWTCGHVRKTRLVSFRVKLVSYSERNRPVETLRMCYEAGPTGYALYWELTKLGVRCEVVAFAGAGQGR